MRWLRHKLRPAPRLVPVLSALLMAGMATGVPGRSQIVTPSAPQAGGQPPFGQQDPNNEDPALHRAEREAAKKRNIDRQSRLVADADRVVALAGELKAEMDKAGANKLPPTAYKKAEEIEKLARGVKERMRWE